MAKKWSAKLTVDRSRIESLQTTSAIIGDHFANNEKRALMRYWRSDLTFSTQDGDRLELPNPSWNVSDWRWRTKQLLDQFGDIVIQSTLSICFSAHSRLSEVTVNPRKDLSRVKPPWGFIISLRMSSGYDQNVVKEWCYCHHCWKLLRSLRLWYQERETPPPMEFKRAEILPCSANMTKLVFDAFSSSLH